jgi:hypothetical protein
MFVTIWIKNVEYTALEANGCSEDVTTDALFMEFTPSISGLKQKDFTVTGATAVSFEETTNPSADASSADDQASSWYRMGIQLPAGAKDGDVVTVEWANDEGGYTITPTSKTSMVYVHVPKRTWAQISNQIGAAFTLNSAASLKIPLPAAHDADSKLMHANGTGIVVDQPGDYEVSISVAGHADKMGALTLSVDNGQKSTFSVMATGDEGETSFPFTADRTMMFSDVAAGTVFELDMKSQFGNTAVALDKPCYLLVRHIRKIERPIVPLQGGHRLDATLGDVKELKIIQRGAYVAHAGVNATWRKEDGKYDTKQYISGKDMLVLKTYHLDVGDAGIPERATFSFVLDVVTGDTVVAPQNFTYSSTGGTATYTVGNTSGSPTIKYHDIS